LNKSDGVPEQADRHAPQKGALSRLDCALSPAQFRTPTETKLVPMQIRKSQAADEHGRKKPLDDSGKAEAMKAKFAQLEGALQEKLKQIQDQVTGECFATSSFSRNSCVCSCIGERMPTNKGEAAVRD
jgi:hypothetical protein